MILLRPERVQESRKEIEGDRGGEVCGGGERGRGEKADNGLIILDQVVWILIQAVWILIKIFLSYSTEIT